MNHPAKSSEAAPHQVSMREREGARENLRSALCRGEAAECAAGRKILTTSQDNRLRVWDYLYATEQV